MVVLACCEMRDEQTGWGCVRAPRHDGSHTFQPTSAQWREMAIEAQQCIAALTALARELAVGVHRAALHQPAWPDCTHQPCVRYRQVIVGEMNDPDTLPLPYPTGEQTTGRVVAVGQRPGMVLEDDQNA